MVYISRSGEIVEGGLYRSVIKFFVAVWALICAFFSTLISKEAADSFIGQGRNSRSHFRGPDDDGPPGPRFKGMSDMRSTPGAGACGSGG
ncbi:hypothetical protein BSKO_03276 [Bryopsis sp. KO-2023]|nr:hypothetical protein BSKO_03276 [Bryopsis sp. KO-2023]